MITCGALHALRMASAEHARGASCRSKQMWTSRSLGALWPVLQVTTIDCGGRCGLARRKAAAIAAGGSSIAWVGLDSSCGIAVLEYARRTSLKTSPGSKPLQVPCADHSW